MSTAARSRGRVRTFEGLPTTAFAFFAELAAHNDRAWFAANVEIYRVDVDRPWRRLVEAVAGPVARRLPAVDAAVKTGRVLSRIQLQWPRPGAAYRTGLRATFAAPEQGRRPDCSMFVSLDASGLRAGAEVRAGSEAFARVQRHLEGQTWVEAGDGLVWSIAGDAWPGGEASDLAARLAGVRRGSLRLVGAWNPEEAVATGAALAPRIARCMEEAAPLYEWGVGAAADARAPNAPLPPPDQGAATPEGRLPTLPRELRSALAIRAEEQGVTLEAFMLYVLTRAATGNSICPRATD